MSNNSPLAGLPSNSRICRFCLFPVSRSDRRVGTVQNGEARAAVRPRLGAAARAGWKSLKERSRGLEVLLDHILDRIPTGGADNLFLHLPALEQQQSRDTPGRCIASESSGFRPRSPWPPWPCPRILRPGPRRLGRSSGRDRTKPPKSPPGPAGLICSTSCSNVRSVTSIVFPAIYVKPPTR